MRNAIAVTMGATLMLTASAAGAQEFGQQGTLAISAERVFGLPWYEKVSLEWDEAPVRVEEDHSWTSFGFAWHVAHTPYTVPRFGIDYFVIDQLSIGGALAFLSQSHDRDGPGGDDDHTLFLIAPRVGYAIPFGRVAGFWPRGGFTFTSSGGDDPDDSELALTVEAMFWLAPAEGVAFLLGPTLDVGITGERDVGPVDADMHRTVVGIAVGLMGWL